MKIWEKIANFFINWFWWNWRARKYDRDSNGGRDTAISFVNELFEKNLYAYIGFGSTLKFFRDGTMKNQDIDIIISRETYESDFFRILLGKYELKQWHKTSFDGRIIVDKYLLNGKVPFEFFVADLGEKETTYTGKEGWVFSRVLDVQVPKQYPYKGGSIVFPEAIDKYLIDNFGINYSKPIGSMRYDFTKHSNLNTLFELGKRVDDE